MTPDGQAGASVRPLLVGLTGGIASGKSSVAAMFRELGVPVVDADDVVHELLAAGGDAVAPVLEAFGEEVRGPDGGIDRGRLGAIVFADAGRRARLEQIVHPLVLPLSRRRLAEAAAEAGSDLAIYEAALLVETGRHAEFDRLVVVTAGAEIRMRRLMKRDGATADAAGARIRAQLPEERKTAVADYVIDNSGHWTETRRSVLRAHEGLLEDARRLRAGRPLPDLRPLEK